MTSAPPRVDRKSTRLNSSHLVISYAVFCLKKKKKKLYNACRKLAPLSHFQTAHHWRSFCTRHFSTNHNRRATLYFDTASARVFVVRDSRAIAVIDDSLDLRSSA